MPDSIRIEDSWREALVDEFSSDRFLKLSTFVKEEYKVNTVYPHPKNMFRAFDLCSFNNVRVVIIGQDPYHGIGQANGLSFAVNEEVGIPPSLQNIFKEIEAETGIAPQRNGDLSRWAKQGVLLLNATLTVRANTPGSHQKKGWEEFTDAAIKALSDKRQGLVFMLWGNYAKKKGTIINRDKHLVLESAHPSPFSAHSGFLGNGHFNKANAFLTDNGQKEIDWR